MKWLAALLFLRRKRRGARIVLYSLLGLIYLLSLRPVADGLIQPLENGYPPPDPAALACDLILVLGGGLISGRTEQDDATAMNSATLRRSYAAFQVWRKAPAAIVLTGGNSYGGRDTDAEAMADFLNSMGIHRDFLILEREGRTTLENAENTAKMVKTRRWNAPCLITSAYHLPRAIRSFAKFGVRATPIPAGRLTSAGGYSWRDFFPQMISLSISEAALHEYLGLAYYMLFFGI